MERTAASTEWAVQQHYHVVAPGLGMTVIRAARRLARVLACVGLMGGILWADAAGTAARAQTFPDRPITIVVSVPSNGVSMRIATALATALERMLAVPVLVSNRPGENGFLGARSVVQAPPDGYTLLLGPSSFFLFDPSVSPDAGYVPERDLDTILMAVRTPYVLVVHPSVPARTVKALIAYMKTRPGTVDFAARWAGSINDLLTAQFWAATGSSGRMTYLADVQAAAGAVMNGTIAASFQNAGDIAPEVQAGHLRALAITAAIHTPALSRIPTFTDEELPDLDAFTWQAIAAPTGLPPDVRKRLEDVLRTALLDRNVMATLDEMGAEVAAMDSRQFARTLADARRRWRSLLLPTPRPR